MEYILSYLYYDWFGNKNYWFDKDTFNDLYLSENYFKLIKNFDLSNYTKQEIIGAIILLDQIPRHHKRINNDYTNVFEYSKKAIFYSELAIKLHYDNLNIDDENFNGKLTKIMNDFKEKKNLNTLSSFFIDKLFIDLGK